VNEARKQRPRAPSLEHETSVTQLTTDGGNNNARVTLSFHLFSLVSRFDKVHTRGGQKEVSRHHWRSLRSLTLAGHWHSLTLAGDWHWCWL